MRFTVAALDPRRRRRRARLRVDGAQHAVRDRPLRPLPARPDARLPRRAGLPLERTRAMARDQGAVMAELQKPTLAVWKFSSCDGCQLSLLDCEDELLTRRRPRRDRLLPGGHAARSSRAPTTSRSSRARSRPPHDAERIHEVRRSSRTLITIGACATAGGIQALRNFADVEDFTSIVYASPEYISTLSHLDADQRPRAGRLSSSTAARSTSTSCSR